VNASTRLRRQESGQVIVLLALSMVALIAICGLVIDVGRVYYAHRALQASADAAALAGGQELPDPSLAAVRAREYGTDGKNPLNEVEAVETVTTRCIASIGGCNPVNSVVVEETANVPTVFLRVMGVDTFRIRARSTACSPCGVRPVDVMMVLDRTGSMCQDSAGRSDPSCTDLRNARDGIKMFLNYMDNNTMWVGLAVFPPATSVGNRCATPATSNYNSASAAYTVVPLSSDYRRADGTLNPSSNLVSTLDCIRGAGSTAYANAIEKAQAELDARGRPGVQDVIVFLTDGAANTGPTYYPTTSPYRRQPCRQGVTSASNIRSSKQTIFYSIAYALEDDTGGCRSYTGSPESPAITPEQALQQIANPGNYYNRPNPGQLNTIYASIAIDVRRGTAGLVDDDIQ